VNIKIKIIVICVIIFTFNFSFNYIFKIYGIESVSENEPLIEINKKIYSFLSEIKILNIFLSSPFLLNWIEVILAALSVYLAISLPLYQQAKGERKNRKEAYTALIREIEENKSILNDDKKYEKIKYNITKELKSKKICIEYTNAYLDIEAFQSIIYSGYFTKLDSETQHNLTHLYDRLKSHNEIIAYIDHYQDLFFIFNDNSDANMKKWYNNIERYDSLLTDLEKEIKIYLEQGKRLLEKEIN
jgi:hypothetical protein